MNAIGRGIHLGTDILELASCPESGDGLIDFGFCEGLSGLLHKFRSELRSIQLGVAGNVHR
jgi:hypothetical protein